MHVQSAEIGYRHTDVAALLADDDLELDHVPAKRGRSNSPSTVETRETTAARVAKTLPGDEAARVAVARAAIEAAHQAILDEDEAAFEAAVQEYDGVVYALNGFTFFASETDEGGAARLRKALAAAPGSVPLWGQAGEFLLDHAGVRAIVQMNGGFGMWGYCSLRAASAGGLFVSDTGFLSLMGKQPVLTCTVEEAARLWLEAEIANRGRVALSAQYRERDYPALYPWLGEEAEATSAPVYREASGQMAFGF
jgi:hypothetical protein